MARGRKKGGFSVDEINDRKQLENMIINQINSLNKKIKGFKNSGIDEHSQYVQALITEDMGTFNENGSLAKSRSFYREKNTVWLKKTLTALRKINNDDYYGTETKYKKQVTKTIKGIQDYAKEYLRSKGYDEHFINTTVNTKEFMVKLLDNYKEVGKGYGSNQAIEKIALSYKDETGFSEEETNKILNNIEYSRNTLARIQEEDEMFQEFKQYRNMKKR